jgi:hypothetical protein
MTKLSKRHFWKWFERHNKEFLELGKKSNKEVTFWQQQLDAHLQAYDKFFEFRVVVYKSGSARLTISVNGMQAHFKKVDEFVATAPYIPGWTIRALEDPMPIDYLLEELMEETGIDPRECNFSFTGQHEKDIIVYHPLYTKDNELPFLLLVRAAIFNLLGERSFGTDIGSVCVDPLSSADANNGYNLLRLPAYIRIVRKFPPRVDHNGNLLNMIDWEL